MDKPAPRLESITGVSRALIATLGVDDAVRILIQQFGWDVAFTALAGVEGPEAGHALWLCLSRHADDARRPPA